MTSPTQRPLPDNTQHSQETDIHAPGGIRTHNPSKRTAEDPGVGPQYGILYIVFIVIIPLLCLYGVLMLVSARDRILHGGCIQVFENLGTVALVFSTTDFVPVRMYEDGGRAFVH
jgi:hypothetical protein